MKKYLQDEYPEIAKEFDIDKNNTTPKDITIYSRKVYWWRCENGHIWQQSVKDRVRSKRGCTQCKSLKFLYSDIANEWDFEKNKDLDVNKIAPKSQKKVWWKCSKCGYSYQMRVDSRTVYGIGCQACKGKRPLIGINDLKSSNLEILNEWNYEKNAPLLPENITVKSTRKVWWKCSKCGYEWKMSVIERTKNKNCPYCIGDIVIKNKNDILTTHPEIINYWDFEKNEKKPEEYSSHSNKIVHWKCAEGHSWKEKISKAITNHFICPICSNNHGTSFPEQAIYYYIKKHFPDAINRKMFHNLELDIYIPTLNLGIEYDGKYYHENEIKDEKKDIYFLRNHGITVIHIVENKKTKRENYFSYFPSNSYYSNINEAIEIIFDYITNLTGNIFSNSIDIELDRPYIYNNYLKKVEYKKSVAYKHPKIEKEWDYEKNYPLTPKNISANVYVWWKCEYCGYEIFENILNRIKREGCILCQSADQALNNMLIVDIYDGNMIKYKGCDNYINDRYLFYKKKEWMCECGNTYISSAYELMNGFKCPKCNKQIKNMNELKLKYNKIIEDHLDRIVKRKHYLRISKNIEKKRITINSNVIDETQKVDLIFMTDNLMKYGIKKVINNSSFNKDTFKLEIDITAVKYENKLRAEIRPLLIARDANNNNLFYARIGDDYKSINLETTIENKERDLSKIRFNEFPQFRVINGVVLLNNNEIRQTHSAKELESVFPKINSMYIIFMSRNTKLYADTDKMIKLINKSLMI